MLAKAIYEDFPVFHRLIWSKNKQKFLIKPIILKKPLQKVKEKKILKNKEVMFNQNFLS